MTSSSTAADRDVVQAADPTARLVYLSDKCKFVVRSHKGAQPVDLSMEWDTAGMAWYEAAKKLETAC